MGAISSIVFSTRNSALGTDDPIRLPVAVAQLYNATEGIAHSGIKAAAAKAENILGKVDELGSKAGVLNASEKIAKIASTSVNPLLIGAAAYRVINDKDKKSALTEEVMGMSAMFGTEKVYKSFRRTVQQAMGKEVTGMTFKNETVTNQASKIAEKLSKMPTGKQKLAFIVAELGFVAASIGAYTIGNLLGKKVTGRDKQKEEVQNNTFGTITIPNSKAQDISEIG